MPIEVEHGSHVLPKSVNSAGSTISDFALFEDPLKLYLRKCGKLNMRFTRTALPTSVGKEWAEGVSNENMFNPIPRSAGASSLLHHHAVGRLGRVGIEPPAFAFFVACSIKLTTKYGLHLHLNICIKLNRMNLF